MNQINQYVLIVDISDSLFSFATTNITYVLLPCIAVPTFAHEIYATTNSNNAEFLAYIQSKYATWLMFALHDHLIPCQLL